MKFNIPPSTEKYGFITDGLGAHSGRTIMLGDLRLLFAACPPSAQIEDYKDAILNSNILLKKTIAARKESFSRLKRLYGLDPEIYLFKMLRNLWEHDQDAQSMLALLYAMARDPILRSTADFVIDLPEGTRITAPQFADVVGDAFPSELNEKTLASIGRNIASTYTQSGHFRGRSVKERVHVESFTTSITYALLLSYLCEERGETLYHTSWVRLLDSPIHEIQTKAQLASQQGWLEYRYAGRMTDISFNYLLQGVDT